MNTKKQREILSDHVDLRLADAATSGRNAIVHLDPDHPGFRDQEYRARRNAIAAIALEYKEGSPVPDAIYTDEEHQLWAIIRNALEPAQEAHACAEYLECVKRMDLPREHIPQLREVSEKINAISGFGLEPVAGLVEPRVFLESLANGVFLCTQYIRHHSTPLYTPEPDVVHEIFGHAVTLASEPLAELNRMFGAAVKRSTNADQLNHLAQLYWFTIEFGLVREGEQVKAYGTGILSSAGELEAIARAELRPLDLNQISRQEYDPTRFQPTLFYSESFEEMYQTLSGFLAEFN
ncbi:MAG TPA: phenylalanine 4-monooxygenase [Pyrinomonadaceae bacterium]|nr:phenylalanine 4-monooxygenase [Pyrinomonadaceae bacterium]